MDQVVGRARIMGRDGANYRIVIISGDDEGAIHSLLPEETLVEPRIGSEGWLVLRDTGLYVSYHLVPTRLVR